jgi:hypothetical protein
LSTAWLVTVQHILQAKDHPAPIQQGWLGLLSSIEHLLIYTVAALQDLRDRTYYLSNGVIRVGGRRVATNAASFTKNDIVGVVLDADQGEIVFLRNGIEQGRARGIRGRLYPFVSFDSEQDQITLLGECVYPGTGPAGLQEHCSGFVSPALTVHDLRISQPSRACTQSPACLMQLQQAQTRLQSQEICC